jgi:translation elongation factor EF-G
MSDNKVLTLGILAHVDAGKTSSAKALLNHLGATFSRQLG